MNFIKLAAALFLITKTCVSAIEVDDVEIPYLSAITTRLEQLKSQEDTKIILVLGARPDEHNHFDFSSLGSTAVFYWDGWNLDSLRGCDPQSAEKADYSEEHAKLGEFINISFNKVKTRKVISEIFKDSVDIIVPDGNVFGYIDVNNITLNDFVSMLKPNGDFIFDTHNAGAYDAIIDYGLHVRSVSILFDPDTFDPAKMDAKESRCTARCEYDAEQGKYVPILRTFQALITGQYYNHDENAVTYSVYPRKRIDSSSSEPLPEAFNAMITHSHFAYMTDWLSRYIATPCQLLSYSGVYPHSFLTSSTFYKHSNLFVIKRI
jgi:hypothetical protein